MKPLASFIIPVKNGQAYLAECLESCLAQTDKRWEAIIVNDGSTDTTPFLIDLYEKKDNRFRSIHAGACRGRSVSRNAGMEMAESDIVLVLDADDMATPNRVGDTLRFFKKNPRVSILYGQFTVIDAFGVNLGHQEVIPFDWENVCRTKLFYIGHSTMAVRRNVLKKVQYTDGPYSENAIDDWKFQADAYKAGFKFLGVPRLFAKYRWIPKQRDEKAILELKEKCLGLK